MTKKVRELILVGLILVGLALVGPFPLNKAAIGQEEIMLDFVFPVQVAGRLAPEMEAKVREFNATHEGIHVTPIFGGNYHNTMSIVELRMASGDPPDVFLVMYPHTLHFYGRDSLERLDPYVEEMGKEWREDFVDAYWKMGTYGGSQWAIPYQGSTPILYYNEEALREAGLDPEGLNTWDDVIEYAKKLTIREGGVLKRWGVEIMVDEWGFQMLALQAGQHIIGETPGKVTIDTEAGRDAMAFYNDLVHRYKVAPKFRLYGDTAEDFVAGETAMMWNTTGSLAFVRDNATFDWNVRYAPKKVQYAVAIGGGALHIPKSAPESHKKAAWTFIEWMVRPENVAWWSYTSGYIPFRRSATKFLGEYWEKLPQAKVAFNQLEYARKWAAWYSAGAVMKIINDRVEEAVATGMDPARFTQELQRNIERIYARYEGKKIEE